MLLKSRVPNCWNTSSASILEPLGPPLLVESVASGPVLAWLKVPQGCGSEDLHGYSVMDGFLQPRAQDFQTPGS